MKQFVRGRSCGSNETPGGNKGNQRHANHKRRQLCHSTVDQSGNARASIHSLHSLRDKANRELFNTLEKRKNTLEARSGACIKGSTVEVEEERSDGLNSDMYSYVVKPSLRDEVQMVENQLYISVDIEKTICTETKYNTTV